MKFNLKNSPWFNDKQYKGDLDFGIACKNWFQGFEKELRKWLENNEKGVFTLYGDGRGLEPQTIKCIKEILGEKIS